MTAVQLQHDMKVRIDDRLHVITGNPDQSEINLRDNATNDMTRISPVALMAKINEGSAEVIHLKIGDTRRREKVKQRLREQIESLPDRERREFDRRHAYVKGIYAHMPIHRSREMLEPIIAEISLEIGDPKTPSFPTVCRWLKDYREAENDPRALIPSYKSRGNRTRRIGDEVLEIIQRAIEERYLNLQQGSAQSAMDMVSTKIEEENMIRLSANKLDTPNMRAIYREIDRLEDFVKKKHRFGKSVAERDHKIVQNAPKVTRPLERVEIDHTVLNLFLIDEETGFLIGRPTITIAIDCYTRWIVGFYIGFEPAGWQSVMHCLRHAIAPKESLRKRFPSIQNEWECYGVMETIVVDNGREFHSESLELACETLGIQLQYSPRKAPWFKGAVERMFENIEFSLLSGARGRRMSQFLKVSEYNPEKDAVAGLNALTEAFCKWVVDVYSHEYHRGLHDKPANAWRKAMEIAPPPRMPTSQHDMMIIMSNVKDKKVHKYGIELNGIKYQSDELGYLRQRLFKGPAPEVQVKFDPSNLGHIYVRDPDSSEFLEVPATDLEYAHGLNLWQQKLIMRWRYRQQQRNHTNMTLVEAREEIRKILANARELNLPVASSKRVARFNGMGSNKVLELPAPSKHPKAKTVEAEEFDDLDQELTELEEAGDFEEDIDLDDVGDDDWNVSSSQNYPEN